MMWSQILDGSRIIPATLEEWLASLFLAGGLLLARQWGFSGLIDLAIISCHSSQMQSLDHLQIKRCIDAERLAISAPAILGAVGGIASSLGASSIILGITAFSALLCSLGTARFCLNTFGIAGLPASLGAIVGGGGAFAAGFFLGALAVLLTILREGPWTPHLIFQAPFICGKRLFARRS